MTARIVYLDQCAISSIVKSKDEFWRQLEDKLRFLLNREAIICPTSQLHYEESMLSEQWRHQLWAKCQELAGRWRFLPLEAVESLQLQRALRKYLGEPEEPAKPPAAVGRCESDLDADEPLAFSVPQRRDETLQEIRRLVEDFQNFESTRAAGIHAHLGRLAGASGLQDELAGEVRRLRPTEREPMAVIRDFLQSQITHPAPFLDLWSRLWATVAQHIHSTVKPRRLKPGDIYDVQAIAYYGPYCDAMFVDNEFRKLASQRNVDVPARYGVRLFSETNREQFRTCLDEIG